jgi:fumarate hydratase subunit beta
MNIKRITTPLCDEIIRGLKAGDEVLLSGVIYTARDQAHQRLVDLWMRGRPLPIALEGQVIYYCGPTGRRPGRAIGACGPTTAGRMDRLTAPLLKAGLNGMIGKGRRSPEVKAAIKGSGAVYFLATGGAGALLSMKVRRSARVAFPELGPEAIYRLTVKDFPLIVGVDCFGRDVYKG